jgi:hypothetical protein
MSLKSKNSTKQKNSAEYKSTKNSTKAPKQTPQLRQTWLSKRFQRQP